MEAGQKIVSESGTVYEVIDPVGFAETLPTARIVGGPNDGVKVILHKGVEITSRVR